MKKILHVIANLDMGGAETDLISKMKRLKNNHRFAVITLQRKGALADQISELGIPVFDAAMKGGWDLAGMRRFFSFSKSFAPDLIHAHMHNAFWAASLMRMLGRKVPIVYTIQKEGFRSGWLERRIEGLLISGASSVLTSSARVKETYFDLGLDRGTMRVVHNCIDYSKFSQSENLLEKEFGVAGPCVIGTVGRLLPVKGHRQLLQSLPAIRARFPEVQCVIVGDGPERDGLRRLADELGVSSCITWTGARKDVQNFLPFFKVFVMPSLSEAFGIAAAEASACGVPVVATSVGGLPEVILEGKTGYLVPTGDTEMLAARVGEILADPALQARMGEAAKKHAGGFSSETLAGKWVEAYNIAFDNGKNVTGKTNHNTGAFASVEIGRRAA